MHFALLIQSHTDMGSSDFKMVLGGGIVFVGCVGEQRKLRKPNCTVKMMLKLLIMNDIGHQYRSWIIDFVSFHQGALNISMQESIGRVTG